MCDFARVRLKKREAAIGKKPLGCSRRRRIHHLDAEKKRSCSMVYGKRLNCRFQ